MEPFWSRISNVVAFGVSCFHVECCAASAAHSQLSSGLKSGGRSARRTQRPKRPPQLRLLEAVVASAPQGPGLLVQLPGGARVELQSRAQLPLVAALVRALEKSC